MANSIASTLYVGVYIGEAVSGQISVAFTRTNTPWTTALVAIGIAGVVIAILILLLVSEPQRQTSLIGENGIDAALKRTSSKRTLASAYHDAGLTFKYISRMRSFKILVLSASFRQLSGNIFGYYMPTYLSDLYPSYSNILSRYGIIVGVVGSVAVLLGGLITSASWKRSKIVPLYLVSIGGMISSVFVLLMIFSLSIQHGRESDGIRVLYGTMSAAYLTAELWLGAINSLIVLLLPPQYKTFGLAVWDAIQVLIYSTGPEIVGLALRNVKSDSQEYLDKIRVVLAVVIPLGYWLAGIGFLWSIPLVRKDLKGDFLQENLGLARSCKYAIVALLLGLMVVVLFVISIVYKD